MINFLNNPLLQEKVMLGFAKDKENGMLFANKLLPERKVNSRAIEYKIIKNTRELAPEIREGSEELLTNIGYAEKSALVKEIREGAMLTEQAIAESDLRDLVADHLDHLVERNVLKQEKMIIEQLVGNAGTVFGTTVDWSQSTSKPLNDILDAVATMKNKEFVAPDTLVIDPSRELELLKHPEFREIILQAKPMELVGGANIKAIGSIRGLTVYVANAVYDNNGAENPFLSKKTIIMKAGSQTGFTAVREGLTVRRFADEGKRAVRLQVFKTLYPVIQRPQNIAIINHV